MVSASVGVQENYRIRAHMRAISRVIVSPNVTAARCVKQLVETTYEIVYRRGHQYR